MMERIFPSDRESTGQSQTKIPCDKITTKLSATPSGTQQGHRDRIEQSLYFKSLILIEGMWLRICRDLAKLRGRVPLSRANTKLMSIYSTGDFSGFGPPWRLWRDLRGYEEFCCLSVCGEG
jgi:hypothetical protein